MPSPIRPTDDAAREMARKLLTRSRSAVLAVNDDGWPTVSRVAFGLDDDGVPVSLVSELSGHTTVLRSCPECSLLIGEPGPKGDPLTHPRLALKVRATLIDHDASGYDKLAAHYLRDHPKAKLYIGFADFHFVRFNPLSAFLNGGFGKALRLSPEDLHFPD